jgi:phosphoribosylglycinamide formyltransferase-1
MTRTAVLVSGGGATLQALLDQCYFDEIPGLEIAAVISSVPGVYALERAANARVPGYVVERAMFPNSASFSNALLGKLRDLDIALAVCAGFTETLSYGLLHAYLGRIINVQPALFPAFCAERFDPARAVEETLRRGVRVTGATAYFTGEEDTGFGPIIAQRAVEVLPGDTAASLSDRIMRQGEWPALTEAVRLFCAGRLAVESDRVIIRAE